MFCVISENEFSTNEWTLVEGSSRSTKGIMQTTEYQDVVVEWSVGGQRGRETLKIQRLCEERKILERRENNNNLSRKSSRSLLGN